MSLMAGGDSGGVLREIQVNLLECKVCFEEFTSQRMERSPQNLSCGHVLCLECVSALTHPVLRKLDCPFCRQLCSLETTSRCQVLQDLQEILQTGPPKTPQTPSCLLPVQCLRSFGGWGTLVNPSGMSTMGSSGSSVVVHDGERRVVVLDEHGGTVQSFGRKGEICFPVDVAVTPRGDVVVTDAGERSLKVFDSKGAHLVSVRGRFRLPWGVDTNVQGQIVVSDLEAGTLTVVEVHGGGSEVECRGVASGLWDPGSVACCRVSGSTAVKERLRLTVFSEDFQVIYQTDPFGLTLQAGVRLSVSAVAFDGRGGLLVVDSDQGAIWSLEKVQKNKVRVTPVVRDHLVRPVAVVSKHDSLVVLDAGDHTVKVFSRLHAGL